jgi:hypothetical protein
LNEYKDRDNNIVIGMPTYTCDDCSKSFGQKYIYIKHVNRKNKCSDRLYENDCMYCNKSFANKSSVTRHIKTSCPTYKKQESTKKEIYDNKIKELLYQVEVLQNENHKLKGEPKSVITNINNVNNVNNGIINNNNITVIAYGKEDLSNIDMKYILEAVSRGCQSAVHLTKAIHFNHNHPEFHNVYIPSMKDSYAMIYTGETWQLVEKNDLIDEMYQDKKDYIEENVEDFYKKLSSSRQNALKKWLEDEEYEEGCVAGIKKNIALALYNDKNMPIKLKKQMSKQIAL